MSTSESTVPDPQPWKQTCMDPVCQLCIQSKGIIWLLESGPAPFKMVMSKWLCSSWNSYVGRYQMGIVGDLGSAGQTAGSGHLSRARVHNLQLEVGQQASRGPLQLHFLAYALIQS